MLEAVPCGGSPRGLSSGMICSTVAEGPPSAMAPPIVWLCSDAASGITGNRYIAQHWDSAKPPEQAEKACRAPAAWPDLAQSPVWPGGKPAL